MKHKQDRDWEYGYHTSIPINEEKRQRKKLEKKRHQIGTLNYGPVIIEDEWINHVGSRDL